MKEGSSILHYSILEKLGEGGMGIVYKARDTKLDRTVALKFLPPHLTRSKKDRQRFIREAKSAAALNHPNICTIHSVEEHEGKDFISMEYINGQTLRKKLESGQITFESALEYAVQIAKALGKAHDKGIIHRDIKPGNIMIDANNHIKVMDFGLAKMADSAPITKTGATVGTMAYMAPEQIEGKQIDHRADLFSFGVVLYEMLTGERPFKGQYDAALTYAITNEDPPLVTDLKPELPQELSRLVNRLLEKEPENRFGSAAEVAGLLERIKESVDIIPRKSPLTESESEPNNQGSGSSTSITLTIPNFGFGKKPISKTGLLATATAMLALVLFIGWWFIGGNASEDNNITSIGSSDSVITNRSIAVLPFTNQGGGEEVSSITQGLHDDLLTRLSNIGDLQVTSRTSVEQYRETNLSLPIIADSLGVQWVVEGGIQEAGGQIRVNAQLIDPQEDIHVWADSYRRVLTAENLFAIQEEIAGEIANALQAELTPDERERITGAPTKDLNAYRLYIQGRSALNTRTERGVVKARDYFQQAIRQDSSYALAWSGLADVIGLSQYGPDSLETSESEHEAAARRALELDPELAEAQASMGQFYIVQQKAPEALHHLKQAVELKPSYAQARHWLGLLLFNIGRLDQASEHLSLAVELNPQHAAARGVMVWVLVAEGRAREAEAHMAQLPEVLHQVLQTLVLYHTDRWDELEALAREQLSKDEVVPSSGFWHGYLGLIAAGEGNMAAAREHLAQVDGPGWRALVYAALGETDAAFAAWSDVEEWSSGTTGPLRYWYPDFLDPLRDDPRYEDLINEVNKYWGLNPDGSLPEEMNTR